MVTKESQRLDARFALWDSDGDGRINKADWEKEATQLTKSFGTSPDSPRGHAVIAAYTQMWDHVAGKAGVGADGSLTPKQFSDAIHELMINEGDAGFANTLRPTIRAIVDLCDTDGDGQVNPAEFKKWLDVIGVDESHADAAFSGIDENGDGQLSVDELVHAVRDYHLGKIDVPLLGG